MNTSVYNIGKDFLMPLFVPFSIAFVGWLIAEKTKQAERKTSQAEALQRYLDRISAVLSIDQSDKQTLSSNTVFKETIRGVVLANTKLILKELSSSPDMKSLIIRFLLESGILKRLSIPVSEFDFSGADLKDVSLRRANLCGSSFKGSDLSYADLRSSRLGRSNLCNCNLSEANLYGAKLGRANLSHSKLFFTILNNADLRWADLTGADMNYVIWNSSTKWPDKRHFRGAINVPNELRGQIGLDSG